MRTETLEGYLAHLASRTPAPGGGAGAALHAAQGAALVAAVARHGDGGRSAAHADVIGKARARADELRELALDLAGQDAYVSAAVLDARRPAPDDEQAEARRTEALAGAGRTAVRVLEVTEQALTLAETLRPLGDRAVLPDVAAAAETLRAAAGTARVNVEVALAGLVEPVVREELLQAVDHVDDLVLRAAKVTAAVREQLLR
ncbi:cyclodeaminase/cyclohydrolase family protein [Actinomycetospora chiangmaiensis]|uniref:cyclodeaminase/cyclohydrolase family protein n=1 Tax=Actinomycetospora chiangmaiensis TaxID=402650 RepID=UPI0003625386|nr:cyclodeaminase/cyclohydrolase family protein [Actinomycetospora chiangmaiensis]